MQVIQRDTLKSVAQNIVIILTTPKGSDPHRPLFGSELWQFLDKPLTAITKGKIKAEIVEAIHTWEPRVILEEVSLKKEQAGLKVLIKYRIEETESVQTEEIIL